MKKKANVDASELKGALTELMAFEGTPDERRTLKGALLDRLQRAGLKDTSRIETRLDIYAAAREGSAEELGRGELVKSLAAHTKLRRSELGDMVGLSLGPSGTERLQDFVEKHRRKALVGAASALGAVMLVDAGVSYAQWLGKPTIEDAHYDQYRSVAACDGWDGMTYWPEGSYLTGQINHYLGEVSKQREQVALVGSYSDLHEEICYDASDAAGMQREAKRNLEAAHLADGTLAMTLFVSKDDLKAREAEYEKATTLRVSTDLLAEESAKRMDWYSDSDLDTEDRDLKEYYLAPIRNAHGEWERFSELEELVAHRTSLADDTIPGDRDRVDRTRALVERVEASSLPETDKEKARGLLKAAKHSYATMQAALVDTDQALEEELERYLQDYPNGDNRDNVVAQLEILRKKMNG